jgi:hypothetical protein
VSLEFPEAVQELTAVRGSFDCASHWLRQCLASLRMTILKWVGRSLRKLALLCSADGRGGRLYMSFRAAGEQQVPPLRRPLRLRSGSGSGRNDKTWDAPRENQEQRQRQRTGVFVPHGRRFAPLTAWAAVST